MKKNKLIYIWVATLLCFSACSDERTEESVRGDSAIRFAPALSDIVWTRAADITYDNFYTFQATCFNPAKPVIDEEGIFKPYFEDIRFGKISSDVFVTEEDYDWPEQRESVDFVAFAPSRTDMAKASDISLDEEDEDHFMLVNKSKVRDGKADYDYSLANIRIADDISRQYDFLTATASGSKFSSVNDPVKLPFHHCMSKVELRAWGKSPVYRIEIAGVRLGIVPLEGSYRLDSENASASSWTVPEDVDRGRVEYIFGKQADEHSLADAVVVIDKNAGTGSTPDSDISLMGEGGAAMIIPFAHDAWDYRAGKNETGGGYISVLMRVSNLKNDDQVAYPYADDNGSEKIWLAVTGEGLVAERLYRGDDGNFYTDEKKQSPYAGDAAVREYGWASIPVDIDWEEGKHYVYTIDYTFGLGVKDPDDTAPGEIILNDHQVNMSVTVTDWVSGGNTDTTVPRK